MKKQFFLSVLFACVAMIASAKIIRVNNNPGAATGVNCYTTWAAAYAAAVDDDIIHIEPSLNPYLSSAIINITKKLTIIGSGSDASNTTGLPANSYASKFFQSRVNFASGSSGSKVYGITFDDDQSANHSIVIDGVNNITIQRCDVPELLISNSCTDISLLENFIGFFDKLTGTVQNLTLKNNIIGLPKISLTTGETGVIENNNLGVFRLLY